MTPTNRIDISVPIHTGMVHWPDNPPVRVDYTLHMDRGDACTVSTLSMGSHTGTHMDSPLHFIAASLGLHEMPLDAAIGRARVIEIRDPESIKREELEPDQPFQRTRREVARGLRRVKRNVGRYAFTAGERPDELGLSLR